MLNIYYGRVDEADIDQHLSCLSTGEMRRYKQLKVPSKAHEFAFTRAKLRTLLAQHLDKEPKDISIMSDGHGKPFCSDNERVTFNVSHSNGHCLIVIDANNQTQLGIDIEAHRSIDITGLSARYFSEREQDILRNCDEEQLQQCYFFNIWSRKEAIVKTHGKGIGLGLQGFTVSADKVAEIIEFHDRLSFMDSWQLHDLQDALPEPGLSACLCCDKPVQFECTVL